MVKYTLSIDGMQCGMCESHINDSIRGAFPVKKVTSSHSKNQTIIISENRLNEEKLKDVIDRTGYSLVSVSSEPYEKKGLFSAFKNTTD